MHIFARNKFSTNQNLSLRHPKNVCFRTFASLFESRCINSIVSYRIDYVTNTFMFECKNWKNYRQHYSFPALTVRYSEKKYCQNPTSFFASGEKRMREKTTWELDYFHILFIVHVIHHKSTTVQNETEKKNIGTNVMRSIFWIILGFKYCKLKFECPFSRVLVVFLCHLSLLLSFIAAYCSISISID